MNATLGKQQVVPHGRRVGPERWEMIPKSRLGFYWTREVLVLTKCKLQDPSLKGAISMVLGEGAQRF